MRSPSPKPVPTCTGCSTRSAHTASRTRASSASNRPATVGEMPEFRLDPVFTPTADQPQAIGGLAEGIEAGERFQTLLGATGTGKTMTMAGAIEAGPRPAPVIAHNKKPPAQPCNEVRPDFPPEALEDFVSYYDYYQPEADVPSEDLYNEKDSAVN